MDLLVILSLSFFAGLALLWLLLFPAMRDVLAQRLHRHRASVVGRAQRLWLARPALDRHTDAGLRRVVEAAQRLLRHGPLLGGALALIVLPVALLLLFGNDRRLAGFDEQIRPRNAVVASLLEGEQLVPPPSLPPEVFVTREVATVRPDLGGADRDWSRLDTGFGQTLLGIFRTMATLGYPMVLIEGYRSPERQSFLQSQGPDVTNAGAFQSYHQFGLAADCAFFRDGHLVISAYDPWVLEGYRRFGETAEAAGLSWGGRWTLRDFGHIEQHQAGRPRK